MSFRDDYALYVSVPLHAILSARWSPDLDTEHTDGVSSVALVTARLHLSLLTFAVQCFLSAVQQLSYVGCRSPVCIPKGNTRGLPLKLYLVEAVDWPSESR